MITTALVTEEALVVVSEFGVYRTPWSEIKGFEGLSFEQKSAFVLRHGSLRWPELDIDLGLDGFRYKHDPEYRAKADAETAEFNARYRDAMSWVCQNHGVFYSPNHTESESLLDTVNRLSKQCWTSPNQFMNEVAEVLKRS
jgi:hypothetical protein